MFRLFQSRWDRHIVDCGRVACELRGRDVEVDLCAGCPWLTSLEEDAMPPVVRCSPQVIRRGPGPLS
jgi:hypothetical protein